METTEVSTSGLEELATSALELASITGTLSASMAIALRDIHNGEPHRAIAELRSELENFLASRHCTAQTAETIRSIVGVGRLS